MQNVETHLMTAWRALQIGLGLAAFLAGLDKFFNLLTDWTMYLSPLAESLLPVSGAVFMRLIGIVEMIVGIAILTSWTRLGAYVASVWLSLIAFNLLLTGLFLDVAVRDLEMALAAFTLARLTEWREVVLSGDNEAVVREAAVPRDPRTFMET